MPNALVPQEESGALSSSAASLRVLHEARTLALLCQGCWTDLSRCEEQGEVIAYAVDADVVKMYTAPEGRAIYGALFDELPADVAGATTLLLGDFIVRRMSAMLGATFGPGVAAAEAGLVLIPPHDGELRGVAAAIQHGAMTANEGRTELRPNDREELGRLLSGDNLTPVDSDRAVELLERTRLLPDLHAGVSSVREEHARLEVLPAGRFISLRSHPWFVQEAGRAMLPPRLPKPLRPHMPLDADAEQLVELVDKWHERLVRIYLDEFSRVPTERKLGNILNDAEVLARLQWVNQRLQQSAAPRRRLVLITGTPTILRAAEKMASPLAGFESFAHAFLRDPRAFLGAKDLAPAPETAETRPDNEIAVDLTELHVADWLSLMFPKPLEQQRFDLERIRGVTGSTVKVTFTPPTDLELLLAWRGDNANPGLQSLPGFPDRQLASLGGALKDVARRVQAACAMKYRKTVVQQLNASRGAEAGDAGDRIVRLLRRRELFGIEHVHDLVASVGAIQLLDASGKMKGVPALRFDEEYAAAQAQAIKLCDMLFVPGLQREFDLQAMESAVHEIDDSGYHARVLKAYVFACVGLWFDVRPQCLSALWAVDAIPGKSDRDHRLGREAAYLLAVAERRLAVSEEGIRNARVALRDARRRNHLPNDLRFSSEALAQNVTEVQLRIHGKISGEPSLDWLAGISEALRLIVAAKNEAPSIIRRWIVRQGVTNGLLLCLLAHERRIAPPTVSGQARELLEKLSAEELAPVLPSDASSAVQRYPDCVSDFVWLVACAVFDASAQRAAQARVLLERDHAGALQEPVTTVERLRQKSLLRQAGVDVWIQPRLDTDSPPLDESPTVW